MWQPWMCAVKHNVFGARQIQRALQVLILENILINGNLTPERQQELYGLSF